MSGRNPSRRDLARLLGLGALGTVAATTKKAEAAQQGEFLLPPPNARVQTTACAHCVVGCGYKVYDWPVTDPSGLEDAAYNALGASFPVTANQPWISPEMHNTVTIDGVPHHIVVLPDPDAEVVNLTGDHTIGASLAQRLYNPATPTADRLKRPQLRVGDQLVDISWDAALDLVARYSQFVLDRWGPLAWGMKTYSYQFYENTFAITKLAFEAIGTPCWAPHDKAAEGSDTPGMSDAGINVFSASYQDWHDAEVLFCSGVSLYDAHGVLFSQWVARGGAKLIVVNPRRDATADYALANGGLFIQLKPGTDTALHNAIARVILENGWEDTPFIQTYVAAGADLVEGIKSGWRRGQFSASYERYVESVLADDDALPAAAAAICGIDEELIVQAAEMMAKPGAASVRPKTSIMLEKGNYWSHNYANTASLASLGLLVGAGNRPGRVISRAGGHQRGMIKAAPYPEHLSPHTYQGNPIGLNLDHWMLEGQLAFAWVIGCTWAGGGSAASGVLFEAMRNITRGVTPQLTQAEAFPYGVEDDVNVDAVLASWQAKADEGGMVLVQQDLYPQRLTELADLVLPAAGWGEATFSRMQGERRLRLYPKLADAPGEARPDWRVIAQVAQRMGFDGFNWPDSNALFEEAALHSAGPHAFRALLEYAQDNGVAARQVLREAGTTGFQCPLSYRDGQIIETIRYHDADLGRGFSTPSGKAHFVTSRWEDVVERQLELTPAENEMWVINRRTSMNWSSMVEDLRVPFRVDQYPVNWLEIHPDDAERLGIEDRTPVVVERDVVSDSWTWTGSTSGRFEGVAYVTDRMRRGVACAYFNYGGDPTTAANSVVGGETEPLTNKNSFKLGRGRILPG
jgi:arsenite oxidase large subunit